MNLLLAGLLSIVLVIDPGHGGDNIGAQYNDNIEKYRTMQTALAMKEELEKYDGIEVYLTHDDPEEDLDLDERAIIAKKLDADFLVSVHFNAKGYHHMYGCEIWIPRKGEINSEAYRLSRFILDEWTENLDIFNRGIKTRKGSKGEYYGILRNCVDREIPAVILEHAHFDNEVDSQFVDSDEDFERFGVLDATGIAKYFGLKSEELGVDYSLECSDLYPVEAKINYAKEDNTPPEILGVELVNVDYDNNQITLTIHAEDKESCIYHYALSGDGGKTFGTVLPWPEHDVYTGEYPTLITVTDDMKLYTDKEIVIKVYNQFDRNVPSEESFFVAGRLPEFMDVASISDETTMQAEITKRVDVISELAKSVEVLSGEVIYQQFSISPLSDEIKTRITGTSYPEDDSNAKINYEDLRYLRVVYKNFDGNDRLGEIICNAKIADDMLNVFKELYEAEYPIEKIKLVDEYGGDDTASMDDNNTSCFNYRVVEGTNKISNHGYGLAIDINPLYNPYVSKNKDGSLHVSPEGGEPYADRTVDCPYIIDKSDTAYKIFKKYGFTWGGSWKSAQDYQHFEKK